MSLRPVSVVETRPPIHYFWSDQYNATVEVTDLDQFALVRASKAYRLSNQGVEARENWTRNLSKVNDYLKKRGLRFRISVDYVPEVSPSVSVDRQEIEGLANEAVTLESELEDLEERRVNLHKKIQNGLPELRDRMEQALGSVKGQIAQKEDRVEQVMEELEAKRRRQNQWQGNGVMSTFLFEVSTDVDLVSKARVSEAVNQHLEDVAATHGNPVRQALEGSNFKLDIEEVRQPRVQHQLEHIGLANPRVLDDLLEDAPDEVGEQVRELHGQVAEQYVATALNDLEVDGSTFKRAKSTPARSISSILTDLEEKEMLTDPGVDPPNTGPSIGTVPATGELTGFDPAEHGPHYYIAGSTGTGKTHLKRVFLENAASLGYNVLNIDPSSLQGIGISLPNEELEAAEGQGIDAEHYWTGNRLRDIPEDFTELFTGVNNLSLKDEPVTEKAAVAASILDEIGSRDFSDNPLFVVLEEADNLSGTVAIDPLRDLVQEGRKFGVHVVLVSQRPKAFNYTEKDIREETSYILMNRRYEPQGLGRLFNIDASNLDRGEAVFVDFLDIPEMVVEIRDSLTRLWSGTPTQDEITEVESLSRDSPEVEFPDLDHVQAETQDRERRSELDEELTPDERQIVEAVTTYQNREGQRPSKGKLADQAGMGRGKASEHIEELVERGVLNREHVDRYGGMHLYSVAE